MCCHWCGQYKLFKDTEIQVKIYVHTMVLASPSPFSSFLQMNENKSVIFFCLGNLRSGSSTLVRMLWKMLQSELDVKLLVHTQNTEWEQKPKKWWVCQGSEPHPVGHSQKYIFFFQQQQQEVYFQLWIKHKMYKTLQYQWSLNSNFSRELE